MNAGDTSLVGRQVAIGCGNFPSPPIITFINTTLKWATLFELRLHLWLTQT